jgi:4'-phosphopantetheinyl transferase
MADVRLLFQWVVREEKTGVEPWIDVNPEQVHVWGFLLDADAPTIEWCRQCLSADELARADRLVSDRHRRRFVLAHGALRMVLSRYCRRRPGEIVFRIMSSGKPVLQRDGESGSASVTFNLAHSHERALIAVANGREVGVDLEKVRPDADVIALARRFLSSDEQRAIEAADPGRRHGTFLQCWVAREAAAKARGTGLVFPLDRDRIDMAPDGKEARFAMQEHSGRQVDSAIRFLPLDDGWFGAVAAGGQDWQMRLRG